MRTGTWTGKDALHHLQSLRMFREVDEEELQEVAAGAGSRIFSRGEPVVSAGDATGWVYIVARGVARVYRMSEDGKMATILIALPGDVLPLVSERSFMDALAEGTVVVRVPERNVRLLEARHPEVALALQDMLGDRLKRTYDLVEELMCLGTADRLRIALQRLADPDGVVSATHEELASVVGATRQQVTACLKTLRDEGIIDFASHGQRRITVLPQHEGADRH